MFHDRSFLVRCFWGFARPILKYCSAVWCSADNTHFKLLDCIVSGACFLTGGVFECDIAHRRSVAVLCMLFKIGCNPMTLSMVLHLCRICQCWLHEVLWSRIGILIAGEPRSITGPLFPSQCPCETILLTLYSIEWDWLVSRAGPMLFYWPKLLDPFCLPLFFAFSPFCP